MAIKTFKEIIDNKGYRISSKDREIFEEGKLQSFFGFSDNDYIEFIAYDVNDNQLPLKIDEFGNNELVKYIKVNTETIKNYFLIKDDVVIERGKFPSQYFIDVKRILNESGYENGIFKTQVTLINRRLGHFNNDLKSKLWIKEISPSRTEISVLPQQNEISRTTDLTERFQIFKNNGEFREDNLVYIQPYLSTITPTRVEDLIKQKYGQKWYSKLEEEFNIQIQTFSTQVYEKFVQAINYHFDNRISTITDINYGKRKNNEPTIQLSVETIKEVFRTKLTEIIDYLLPKRTFSDAGVDISFDESIDKVGEVLQRRESDTKIKTQLPLDRVVFEKTKTIAELEFESLVDDLIIEEEVEFQSPDNNEKVDSGNNGGGQSTEDIEIRE